MSMAYHNKYDGYNNDPNGYNNNDGSYNDDNSYNDDDGYSNNDDTSQQHNDVNNSYDHWHRMRLATCRWHDLFQYCHSSRQRQGSMLLLACPVTTTSPPISHVDGDHSMHTCSAATATDDDGHLCCQPAL